MVSLSMAVVRPLLAWVLSVLPAVLVILAVPLAITVGLVHPWGWLWMPQLTAMIRDPCAYPWFSLGWRLSTEQIP